MKIGSVTLESPFALAPMAGMTDTSFRRLVKRRGGCGLVVTEMVSAEGLVRGIDRTLVIRRIDHLKSTLERQLSGRTDAAIGRAEQDVATLLTAKHYGEALRVWQTGRSRPVSGRIPVDVASGK